MHNKSSKYSSTNLGSAKLIISIKEARKLLGVSYNKYSEEEIIALIKDLDAIAEAFVKPVPIS